MCDGFSTFNRILIACARFPESGPKPRREEPPGGPWGDTLRLSDVLKNATPPNNIGVVSEYGVDGYSYGSISTDIQQLIGNAVGMLDKYGVDGYSYGSISTDIQQLIGNAVGMLDKYVLIRTGEYEYSALIQSPGSDTARQITVSRNGIEVRTYSPP